MLVVRPKHVITTPAIAEKAHRTALYRIAVQHDWACWR